MAYDRATVENNRVKLIKIDPYYQDANLQMGLYFLEI